MVLEELPPAAVGMGRALGRLGALPGWLSLQARATQRLKYERGPVMVPAESGHRRIESHQFPTK